MVKKPMPSPHTRQQAIAHPCGIVLVAIEFLKQRLVLKRGADDGKTRCKSCLARGSTTVSSSMG